MSSISRQYRRIDPESIIKSSIEIDVRKSGFHRQVATTIAMEMTDKHLICSQEKLVFSIIVSVYPETFVDIDELEERLRFELPGASKTFVHHKKQKVSIEKMAVDAFSYEIVQFFEVELLQHEADKYFINHTLVTPYHLRYQAPSHGGYYRGCKVHKTFLSVHDLRSLTLPL